MALLKNFSSTKVIAFSKVAILSICSLVAKERGQINSNTRIVLTFPLTFQESILEKKYKKILAPIPMVSQETQILLLPKQSQKSEKLVVSLKISSYNYFSSINLVERFHSCCNVHSFSKNSVIESTCRSHVSSIHL